MTNSLTGVVKVKKRTVTLVLGRPMHYIKMKNNRRQNLYLDKGGKANSKLHFVTVLCVWCLGCVETS